MRSRRVVLSSRPSGIAQADNFRIEEVELGPLEEGEVLVRNAYLSVEPAMRGWIADPGNYAAPVGIGETMRSLASGYVVASRSPAFREGDAVAGWLGWQEHAVVTAEVIERIEAADLRLALGLLGINGLTAYLALTRVGAPRPGETVLVSSAAGAVGSAVGQIAGLLGCRTVGLTGGADKADLCRAEYGYTAAINYREDGLDEAIANACADGVHVYFDNTAGAISDAVMPHLAIGARVVVCGTAALDRWNPWPSGPRVERHLLVKRARMEGFVIFDHTDSFADARQQLRVWLLEGKLRYREDVLEGLDACPDALAGLYRGDNRGKRLIRLETMDHTSCSTSR